MVSAVRPTRWRAPGGSFIWPKTITVLSMHARLGHLAEQVVPLTRALADAGEDGVAAVLAGDVADQLLDDDRLADAGAAEDADLAAPLEGSDQVDHLDAGLEDLRLGLHLVEAGGGAVDRQGVGLGHLALAVDRVPEHVEDAPEGHRTDRHRDGSAGINGVDATRQAIGG